MVTRSELSAALAAVVPAVAGKNGLAALRRATFVGGRVRAFDGAVAASAPLAGLGVEFSADHAALAAWSAGADGEVVVERRDGSVVLRSGRSSVTVPAGDPDPLVVPEDEAGAAVFLHCVDDLVDALGDVLPHAEQESASYSPTAGVSVRVESSGEFEVIATDGRFVAVRWGSVGGWTEDLAVAAPVQLSKMVVRAAQRAGATDAVVVRAGSLSALMCDGSEVSGSLSASGGNWDRVVEVTAGLNEPSGGSSAELSAAVVEAAAALHRTAAALGEDVVVVARRSNQVEFRAGSAASESAPAAPDGGAGHEASVPVDGLRALVAAAAWVGPGARLVVGPESVGVIGPRGCAHSARMKD